MLLDALEEEELYLYRQRRRELKMARQASMTRLSDGFIEIYRISRMQFEELCEELVPYLPPERRRDAIGLRFVLLFITYIPLFTINNFIKTDFYLSAQFHDTINDIIRKALVSVNTPSILEEAQVVTLVPWVRGKPLVCDATCLDTLTPTHISATAGLAGAAAPSVENLK